MALIDPNELLAQHSAQSLREHSEAYFRQASDWAYLQGKPFMDPTEAATISGHLAGMLSAAQLEADMSVLDFGAGSAWLSRLLCQMNCNVISLDISEHALKIGQELFQNYPPLKGQKSLSAVTFDGLNLPLATNAFERILVMDAFHHVMDFRATLDEFFRILKPGGAVIMVEPGPSHSNTPQSQHEMREFGVPERDIDIIEIDRLAREVGFSPLRSGIYSGAPFFIEVEDFIDEDRFSEVAVATTHHFLENHRLIKLTKLSNSRRTVWNSRSSSEILHTETDEQVTLEIRNTGESSWFSIPHSLGHIRLGIRLAKDAGITEIPIEFLPHGESLEPGESIQFEVPDEMRQSFSDGKIDVVAEGLFWFQDQSAN